MRSSSLSARVRAARYGASQLGASDGQARPRRGGDVTKVCSLCTICGRRYDFEVSVCPHCRVPERVGARGAEVRLWHLTESERGPVYDPPGSLKIERR
jgi:hypothetical protein